VQNDRVFMLCSARIDFQRNAEADERSSVARYARIHFVRSQLSLSLRPQHSSFNAHRFVPISIVVVTGASGAGKTAAVSALDARELPGVQCFFFDSIGVPTLAVMDRDYGGPEQWQTWATHRWLAQLSALDDSVRVAVLDAQTRPSIVFAAPGCGTSWRASVVLFDCSSEVRIARLCGPRGQPELATGRMDNWASYLRGQADALGLPIVDTSDLTIDEVSTRLEVLVRQLTAISPPAT
jgi:hypothetical protein